MAKTCPSCGNEYVGLEPQCMPCRRARKPIPVTKSVTPVTKNVTQAEPVTKSVTEADAGAMGRAARDKIDAAAMKALGACPTCGRPFPMSDAERQRRSRARRKA